MIRALLRKEPRSNFRRFIQCYRPWSIATSAFVLSFALAWTWKTLSPADNQELIAQAISNQARSLLVNHLVDLTSSDPHTLQTWFTLKLNCSTCLFV
jgi:hypothetical protein